MVNFTRSIKIHLEYLMGPERRGKDKTHRYRQQWWLPEGKEGRAGGGGQMGDEWGLKGTLL